MAIETFRIQMSTNKQMVINVVHRVYRYSSHKASNYIYAISDIVWFSKKTSMKKCICLKLGYPHGVLAAISVTNSL